MMTEQTECKRCGSCCNNGGPALHKEDLLLIESGLLPLKRLITIRRGELVQKPDDSDPRAAKCELIKIAGTGRDWQCFFFNDTEKSCLIYQDRPLSCRELKCWDTAAVEGLIEKDTLSRFDIVDKDEPIYAYIEEHENNCPTPDMEGLKQAVLAKSKIDVEALEELVNEDIRLRSAAVQDLDISLAEELFYFGRPIFQQLQMIGVKVTEAEGMLRLRLPT